ncbi:probable crossover junction endonuclease EME2 [Clupea harengus]|uniref:Probable crossover junction endonuclease EME2 n=1 Tax=Clupea harengus TaxID=7950 RepID=A0A6P3W8X4_CLUHA|nr:probable crossover junction endonuclease EME2 [Clupea harengus]
MSVKRVQTWELSDSESESDSEGNPKRAYTHVSVKDGNTLSVPQITEARLGHGMRSDAIIVLEEDAKDALKPSKRTETNTPSPGKKRRSRDEVDTDRARAEEKKAERERAKKEREKKKEEKKQEQQQRKEAAERLKSYRPENYVKCLTVRIHPVLLQDGNSDVLSETLSELEWKSCIEPHSLTHSITWKRSVPQEEAEDGEVEEEQVLMVISLYEFMDVVQSVKQVLKGDSSRHEKSGLLAALSDHLNTHTESVVTMLVMGSGQHRKRGSWYHSHGDLRSQLGMQDVEIEEVLVYLELYKSVCVHFLYNWKEVTDQVCTYTKALSKRPFKALSECTELGFCVDGSWAGGTRVERDGKGLAEVWGRQIQQLNRVSPAVATAVTSAYPSPQLLLQAYEKLDSEKERRALLADLTVKGMVKERRVGPEFSARIYRVLTTENTQLVLD